jgi:hypothetical protein
VKGLSSQDLHARLGYVGQEEIAHRANICLLVKGTEGTDEEDEGVCPWGGGGVCFQQSHKPEIAAACMKLAAARSAAAVPSCVSPASSSYVCYKHDFTCVRCAVLCCAMSCVDEEIQGTATEEGRLGSSSPNSPLMVARRSFTPPPRSPMRTTCMQNWPATPFSVTEPVSSAPMNIPVQLQSENNNQKKYWEEKEVEQDGNLAAHLRALALGQAGSSGGGYEEGVVDGEWVAEMVPQQVIGEGTPVMGLLQQDIASRTETSAN